MFNSDLVSTPGMKLDSAGGVDQLEKTQLFRRLDVEALNDNGYNDDKWNCNGKPANGGRGEACDTNDIDKFCAY